MEMGNGFPWEMIMKKGKVANEAAEGSSECGPTIKRKE